MTSITAALRAGRPLAPTLADLRSSLVVFLVAVPLSLGIAVASGAPVIAGLVAAVAGGVMAGLVGGAPLQVSGPAAGLTVIVADLVERFGWRATCAITVAAGIVQVVMGATRVARYVVAVAPAIVHGMLAGIGVTIVLAQLHVVLGGAPHAEALANLRHLPAAVIGHHPPAVVAGLLAVVTMLVWRRAPRALATVPAPLAAVVVATAVVAAFGLDARRVDLPGDVLSALALPAWPTGHTAVAIVVAVATVAIVASIESMLSAIAVDRLASRRDGGASGRADLDRELVGQGLANVLSGAAGGLPVTGVIVRSSANVQAGARTSWSAVLHGVWVAVFVLALGGVVEQIPLAALAGLLVVVGVRLVDLAHLRDLHRHRELPVYVATVVGVVVFDLLRGVALGLVVLCVMTVKRALGADVVVRPGADGARIVIEGSLSFLSLPRLSRVLHTVAPGADVTIELRIDYLDHAAFEHLEGWRALHEATGGRVSLVEVGDQFAERSGDVAVEPSRRNALHLPRWFAPWSHWQEVEPHAAAAPGARVLAGVEEFNRRTAELLTEVLGDLASHQDPDVLFVACSDSRVVPNVLTSSGPGDLFTVRNIGNLVPRPTEGGDGSVSAALEFAVARLGVRAVVVCGHSDCGAMKAILAGEARADGPLPAWLRVAGRTDGEVALDPDALARRNVVRQLEHLREHDVVAQAVAGGRLAVIGMYFDIGAGRVAVYDPVTDRFVGDPSLAGRSATDR